MSQSELTLAAYHESGHCVAGSLLARRVRDARIWPSGMGVTRYHKSEFEHQPTIDHAMNKITDLISGPVAEYRYLFGNRRLVQRFSADVSFRQTGVDFELARYGCWLVTSLGGRPPVPVFKDCVDRAVELVTTNWMAVQTLAKALCIERRCTGERVREVLALVDLYRPLAGSL